MWMARDVEEETRDSDGRRIGTCDCYYDEALETQ
jgi:hypothetical protein